MPVAHRQGERQGRRVLVVYVGAGAGHRSVAEAIAEQLEDADGSIQASVVDALSAVSKTVPLHRLADMLYRSLATPCLRPAYRALYSITSRRPGAVAALLALAFRRRAAAVRLHYKPDMIVSTFPYVFEVLGPTAPLIAKVQVVTDAGRVHGAWGRPGADVVTMRHSLVDPASLDGRGAAAALPLRRAAQPRLSPAAARAALGLTDAPTVLLWASGPGVARGALRVARVLTDAHPRPQLVMVAGRNNSLRRRLERLPLQAGDKVLGWQETPGTLLAAADVVLGKAGWLSLSEAAGAGRPTLLFDWLPGQEEENARVAVATGLAVDARDIRDLHALLARELVRAGPVPVPVVRLRPDEDLADILISLLYSERAALERVGRATV